MLVLLPVLALGTCILALAPRARGRRDAIVNGAAVWGTLVVGITELLSLVHGLTNVGLSVAWSLVFLITAAYSVQSRAWLRLSLPSKPLSGLSIGLLVPLGIMLAVFREASTTSDGRPPWLRAG